jgi:hypothetical protein
MFLLPWLIAVALFVVDEWVMTVLVRREYFEHRPMWEADGKPRPMFWVPPETILGGWYVTYGSGRAYRNVLLRWLFATPAWIRKDDSYRSLLLLHRLLVPIAALCVIAPFLFAALTQRW